MVTVIHLRHCNVVPHHFYEGLNAGLHGAVQRSRTVTVQGKDWQMDIFSDNTVMDVPVTEALHVMDKAVYVPLP